MYLVSSHLLARRGMAQRIGNLIGHLHFSDDDLQKTQKGLKEAGVPMPNFGNVGRELAKEIDEEVEIEVESQEERKSISKVYVKSHILSRHRPTPTLIRERELYYRRPISSSRLSCKTSSCKHSSSHAFC